MNIPPTTSGPSPLATGGAATASIGSFRKIISMFLMEINDVVGPQTLLHVPGTETLTEAQKRWLQNYIVGDLMNLKRQVLEEALFKRQQQQQHQAAASSSGLVSVANSSGVPETTSSDVVQGPPTKASSDGGLNTTVTTLGGSSGNSPTPVRSPVQYPQQQQKGTSQSATHHQHETRSTFLKTIMIDQPGLSVLALILYFNWGDADHVDSLGLPLANFFALSVLLPQSCSTRMSIVLPLVRDSLYRTYCGLLGDESETEEDVLSYWKDRLRKTGSEIESIVDAHESGGSSSGSGTGPEHSLDKTVFFGTTTLPGETKGAPYSADRSGSPPRGVTASGAAAAGSSGAKFSVWDARKVLFVLNACLSHHCVILRANDPEWALTWMKTIFLFVPEHRLLFSTLRCAKDISQVVPGLQFQTSTLPVSDLSACQVFFQCPLAVVDVSKNIEEPSAHCIPHPETTMVSYCEWRDGLLSEIAEVGEIQVSTKRLKSFNTVSTMVKIPPSPVVQEIVKRIDNMCQTYYRSHISPTVASAVSSAVQRKRQQQLKQRPASSSIVQQSVTSSSSSSAAAAGGSQHKDPTSTASGNDTPPLGPSAPATTQVPAESTSTDRSSVVATTTKSGGGTQHHHRQHRSSFIDRTSGTVVPLGPLPFHLTSGGGSAGAVGLLGGSSGHSSSSASSASYGPSAEKGHHSGSADIALLAAGVGGAGAMAGAYFSSAHYSPSIDFTVHRNIAFNLQAAITQWRRMLMFRSFNMYVAEVEFPPVRKVGGGGGQMSIRAALHKKIAPGDLRVFLVSMQYVKELQKMREVEIQKIMVSDFFSSKSGGGGGTSGAGKSGGGGNSGTRKGTSSAAPSQGSSPAK